MDFGGVRRTAALRQPQLVYNLPLPALCFSPPAVVLTASPAIARFPTATAKRRRRLKPFAFLAP